MQGTVWGLGVDVEIITNTEATSCVRHSEHTPFLKLNKDHPELTD